MITRARIRRHLYKGGGITTLRQKYGAGDLVRKLIPLNPKLSMLPLATTM